LNAPGPRPGFNGPGSLAPHQAETLREVAAETAEERRVSWNNGDIGDLQKYAEDLSAGVAGSLNQSQHSAGGRAKMAGHHQQDALAIAQNGGHDLVEDDLDDADDDGMDDDMDKISSSPSIEDGRYTPSSFPSSWPPKDDSFEMSASSCASLHTTERGEVGSSSPYLHLAEYVPLQVYSPVRQRSKASSAQYPGRHHHLLGGYVEQDRNASPSPSINTITRGAEDEELDTLEDDCALFGDDDSFSTAPEAQADARGAAGRETCRPPSRSDRRSRFDEAVAGLDGEVHDEANLTFPYEDSDGDDDDDSCFSELDARFVDSGWDGECLRNPEDIDFDFVYALHTFVATVEGQANATKGDTMVLLDDSNSYWWLVRVVKDSSIGMFLHPGPPPMRY